MGYKDYDLDAKHLFISRDVQFHEDIFPFATDNNSSLESALIPRAIFDELPDLVDNYLPTIDVSPPLLNFSAVPLSEVNSSSPCLPVNPIP